MATLEMILMVSATLGGLGFLFGVIASWLLGAKRSLRGGSLNDRAGVALDIAQLQPGLGTAAAGFWHNLGTKDGAIVTYLGAGGLILAFVTGVPGYYVGRINARNAETTRTLLEAANNQVTTGQRHLSAHFKAKGRLPITLDEVYPPAQAPGLDPWGHPLRYDLIRPEVPFGYRLSSDGPDGAPGTDDDIGAR